jgi:hypothetical protein
MCKEGSWGGGYYVCGKYHQTRGCTLNSFRRIHLEEAIRDYLARVLKDEDVFENIRGLQRNGTAKDARSEIARLQKQLSDFPLRTTRVFDLYETGDISRPEFLRRRDQLTALEGQLLQSIAEKERLVQDLRSHQLTRDMFEELRNSFERLWDSSDPAERKRALWNLIERITIKDKTFKIDFRLPELTSRFQSQGPGIRNSTPNS